MKLLIVRHAAAEGDEAAREAGLDATRGLAKPDRWRMRSLGKGFRELVPSLDAVVTSPVARARQTAEILCDLYGLDEPTPVDALAPDASPPDFLGWLARSEASAVAAVGHDGHLSALASLLVTGRPKGWIPLKRGGGCMIEIDGEPKPGAGRLLWVVTPAILKRL